MWWGGEEDLVSTVLVLESSVEWVGQICIALRAGGKGRRIRNVAIRRPDAYKILSLVTEWELSDEAVSPWWMIDLTEDSTPDVVGIILPVYELQLLNA